MDLSRLSQNVGIYAQEELVYMGNMKGAVSLKDSDIAPLLTPPSYGGLVRQLAANHVTRLPY